MSKLYRPSLLLYLLLLLPSVAFAEKADRNKPINIEADTLTSDDAKKISIYTGNVILTQGTIEMHADKMVVHEDVLGFQHSTSTGNPTTFKQKEDGKDEYIKGSAQRIEYDGRLDKVRLYTKAWVSKGDDIVHGDYIMYDANSEYSEVLGGDSKTAGSGTTPSGRVRAVIQPKKKTSTTDVPSGTEKPANE
jgi:lipopolysaccharide export system protein LptA